MTARRTPPWVGAELFASVRPAGSLARSGRARRLLGVLGAYAAVGLSSAAVAVALGHNPMARDGWLGMHGAAALLISLGLGVCLGALTVAATRAIVRRAEWARELHLALRPAVYGVSDRMLFALAIASATGEELLFRGLLVPTIGVLASSLVFGMLHQIRGRGRWGWMLWATLMGVFFAVMFVVTGSLAGPLVAHAAINHANLRFLRDSDPAPPLRHLGGLLRR